MARPRGVDVNAVNECPDPPNIQGNILAYVCGETALHGTAYTGSNTVAQFLVDKGAKVSVKNRRGQTPLTMAEGVFQSAVFQVHKSTADLLRKLGGDTQ